MKVSDPDAPAKVPDADNVPALLNCSQAAKFLGVSRTSFYQLRSEGKIPKPVALLASDPRWRRSDLMRFVERLRPFTNHRPGRRAKAESVAE